ncbi:MAG: Trk system potassium transporter TrkA [Pseudomonadota bacterium]|nr:Trk system potassium transporter TrkA [Pseudomonadota bacterium]
MKIAILGAGQVGTSMAEILSDDNDVTLVDLDPGALAGLQDRLDIRTVQGSASHPEVLEQAGIQDTDLLLAVTDRDEVNMVACQIAHILYSTPKKIARVRAPGYLAHAEKIFLREKNENEEENSKLIPINVIISPEQIITRQIQRLIEYPGALQVIDFADGRIRLVGLRAYHGGALVGRELRELRDHLPSVKTRVAALYRQDRPIIPTGKTVIESDDEIFFIAPREEIRKMISELRSIEKAGRSIILAGAGNVGFQLAQTLEKSGYRVKLIERNAERARFVSEQLEETFVLHGDAADEELLLQENIENVEVFCALTNEDAANIISAVLAKRLGARRVMAIVNRAAYVDLIESDVLDIAISPRIATVGTLLAHMRRGDVVAAHSLRRGAAEVIEAVAHGDAGTSKVVGKTPGKLKLPHGTTIGTILRGDEVLTLEEETIIEDGDHVILFMIDKKRIPEVEKLFQVAATFF